VVLLPPSFGLTPPEEEGLKTTDGILKVRAIRISIHLIRIRIQHFRLITDPDTGFEPKTKNLKKFTAEKQN
jgi:hypothetical protein